MNRFRFQLLYFEALVELVRMGFIVLALDGFEEMFIERASGMPYRLLEASCRPCGRREAS